MSKGVSGAGKGQAHLMADGERMPVNVNCIFRDDTVGGHVTGTRNLSQGYVSRLCPRARQVWAKVKPTL